MTASLALIRAKRRCCCLAAVRLLALTTVFVLAIGCQGAEDGLGLEVLPLRTAEPDPRIGSFDDADYSFSHVNVLEVAPDGSIYSLHRQERSFAVDG